MLNWYYGNSEYCNITRATRDPFVDEQFSPIGITVLLLDNRVTHCGEKCTGTSELERVRDKKDKVYKDETMEFYGVSNSWLKDERAFLSEIEKICLLDVRSRIYPLVSTNVETRLFSNGKRRLADRKIGHSLWFTMYFVQSIANFIFILSVYTERFAMFAGK